MLLSGPINHEWEFSAIHNRSVFIVSRDHIRLAGFTGGLEGHQLP
jgi:hypothetical protein